MSKQKENEHLLRLTKLIKGLSAKSNIASFRNDYGEIVRHFPEDVRVVLNKAREAAEEWNADSHPETAGPAEHPAPPADATPTTAEQATISTEKAVARSGKAKAPAEQAKPPSKETTVPVEEAKVLVGPAKVPAGQSTPPVKQAADPVEQATLAAGQWQKLYREGGPRIPVAFFIALLRKLPATGVSPKVWKSFLVTCRSGEIIESLLTAGHVARKSISDWLESDFPGFYASALLDVALDSKLVKPSTKIWREIAGLGARPSGLIAQPDLLVEIYDRWHAPEADAKLLSYLTGASTAEKQKVFRALLPRPIALARCVKLATNIHAQRRNASRADASLLGDLLRFLTDAQQSNDMTEAMVASVNLGLLRLYPAIPGSAHVRDILTPFELEVREAAVGAALAIAHSLEEDSNLFHSALFVVLRGSELRTVIEEHIKNLGSLASSGSGDSEPVERQSQYQRHAGQREILQKITNLVSGDHHEAAIREELEVLLFNAGVRRLGKVGEHVPFEPRLHRSKTAGTIAGETVEVLKEGHQLGEGDDGMILTKVIVRAIDE